MGFLLDMVKCRCLTIVERRHVGMRENQNWVNVARTGFSLTKVCGAQLKWAMFNQIGWSLSRLLATCPRRVG